MEVSELMIGDVVLFEERCAVVIKISGSEVLGYMIGDYGKKYYFDMKIPYLSPIPITEKFLERNGFKKRYDVCHEKEIEAYYVEISKESNMGDDYVHCHVDNCNRCTVANADIQYVHQLQNLLNIMNIKFDIEL